MMFAGNCIRMLESFTTIVLSSSVHVRVCNVRIFFINLPSRDISTVFYSRPSSLCNESECLRFSNYYILIFNAMVRLFYVITISTHKIHFDRELTKISIKYASSLSVKKSDPVTFKIINNCVILSNVMRV